MPFLWRGGQITSALPAPGNSLFPFLYTINSGERISIPLFASGLVFPSGEGLFHLSILSPPPSMSKSSIYFSQFHGWVQPECYAFSFVLQQQAMNEPSFHHPVNEHRFFNTSFIHCVPCMLLPRDSLSFAHVFVVYFADHVCNFDCYTNSFYIFLNFVILGDKIYFISSKVYFQYI